MILLPMHEKKSSAISCTGSISLIRRGQLTESETFLLFTVFFLSAISLMFAKAQLRFRLRPLYLFLGCIELKCLCCCVWRAYFNSDFFYGLSQVQSSNADTEDCAAAFRSPLNDAAA